jgi:hypothetical protein
MKSRRAPKIPKISKTDAIAAFGGNASELARAVGVNRQAIRIWGDYIPGARAFQLALMFPETFVIEYPE